LVSGCARTRKLWRFDERRTQHTRVPHYLLTTARVRKDIFISSLSFDENKKFLFLFSKLDEEPRRETILLIDLRTCGPISMCSTSEISATFGFVGFSYRSRLSSALFSERHFNISTKDSIYTQSLNICGKS
jgi:hypothetical protein